MVLSSISTLGLLLQTTALATASSPRASHPAPPPAPPRPAAAIRAWVTDSTLAEGATARLRIRVRDAGYLAVLHVDPAGLVRVVFPRRPGDDAAVPAGATVELVVPTGSDGGIGTVLAARARTPLQVGDLRAGSRWDYDNGLLFAPTAGDPLAALLDIADRLTGGRPYDSDVKTYRTGGPLPPRDPQLITPVCLYCVRSRPEAPPPPPAAPIIQTTSISQPNTVYCSSGVMTNSFCGVVDNRVTNTYVYNEAARGAPAQPVYVPYYVPFVIPRRRFAPPPPAMSQTTSAAANPMPAASVVPSSTFLRGLGRRPR
jgi:hypothetical protein